MTALPARHGAEGFRLVRRSGVPQGTEGEASSLWKLTGGPTNGAAEVVVLMRPPAPLTP